MKPTTFPAQNTHRVVLFQPDLTRSDFDRIEDLGADAVAAARTALEVIERLQHPLFTLIGKDHRIVAEAVDRRRVLSDDYRRAMADMRRTLAPAEVADAKFEAQSLEARNLACHALTEALDLSNRVADLLAAEKDIGWHRGIRG